MERGAQASPDAQRLSGEAAGLMYNLERAEAEDAFQQNHRCATDANAQHVEYCVATSQ
jgi:hypothetical protein